MKKITLIASLLLSLFLTAQEKIKTDKQKKPKISSEKVAKVSAKELKASKNTQQSVKYSPQEFYIIDDKPVDLETYQKHQKQLAKNKK